MLRNKQKYAIKKAILYYLKNYYMKKLKIYPSALEIRNADLPVVLEIKAVKLTYEQAMTFNEAETYTFAQLLAKYGENQRLQVGEFYDGYVAMTYPWNRAIVAKMLGVLRRVPAEVAKECIYNSTMAANITKGEAWQVVYPRKDGGFSDGAFKYVWSFNGCIFASLVERIKKNEGKLYGVDAKELDATLKRKLAAALLTEDKVVELTDDEDLVLRAYAPDYYRHFFAEVD